MSTPWTPDRTAPWPPSRMKRSTEALSPALRNAIVSDPAGAVVLVNGRLNGYAIRWSTRSVDIIAAEVDGGTLAFDGKLVGDGSYRSSVSLTERSTEIATFSIDADNTEQIGITRDRDDPGGYVVPIAGGAIEVSLCHVDVDWSNRRRLVYGRANQARYGPDGSTLSFSVSPPWRGIDRVTSPSIDLARFPDAPDATLGKPLPVVAGYAVGHRILRLTGDGVPERYIISGVPVGCTVTDVRTTGGALVDAGPVASTFDVDGLGDTYEHASFSTSDDELVCTVKTDQNGFFRWNGDEPATIADLIVWILVRLARVNGDDLDLSGAIGYGALHHHSYGMSLDAASTVRELLEERIVPQTFGYASMRQGRYGFSPAPLSHLDGGPVFASHFVYGRELLAGGAVEESGDEDLVNELSADWRYNAAEGVYENTDMRTTNIVNSRNSFWARVSAAISGQSGAEALEFPDLLRWEDVRSAMRLDERLRGLVLRAAEYTCTSEVLVAEAGSLVQITDERNGWERKPFFVAAVGQTTRPVASLQLIEWPTLADFFAVVGITQGPWVIADPGDGGVDPQV